MMTPRLITFSSIASMFLSLSPTTQDREKKIKRVASAVSAQSQGATGKLIKVETLTKSGNHVAYEAKILTNRKRSEVQVGPDGKPLSD